MEYFCFILLTRDNSGVPNVFSDDSSVGPGLVQKTKFSDSMSPSHQAIVEIVGEDRDFLQEREYLLMRGLNSSKIFVIPSFRDESRRRFAARYAGPRKERTKAPSSASMEINRTS